MRTIPTRTTRRTLILGAVLSLLTLAALPAQAAVAQPPHISEYELDCNPPISLGPPYTYDDTSPDIKYSGQWKTERPGRGLYQGTQHITNVGGSTMSFRMPTHPYYFAFGYTKMRNAGKAAIYLDNQFITTIDMYAPTTTYNCAVILYWIPQGTLMVKTLNQRNPTSTGTYINVDYIYHET